MDEWITLTILLSLFVVFRFVNRTIQVNNLPLYQSHKSQFIPKCLSSVMTLLDYPDPWGRIRCGVSENNVKYARRHHHQVKRMIHK